MSRETHETRRDRVANYLLLRPHEWVDGLVLQQLGGAYAWRTRVSDCRTQLGMTVENRVRRRAATEGDEVRVSEYRYVPPRPAGQQQLVFAPTVNFQTGEVVEHGREP
jgi:hypothetical protein